MSLARFNKRRDVVEREILAALARIDAVTVQMDWLDLLVGWGSRWVVLECKTGNAKLLPHQQERIAMCQRAGLPAYVVRTAEEALQAVGAIR